MLKRWIPGLIGLALLPGAHAAIVNIDGGQNTRGSCASGLSITLTHSSTAGELIVITGWAGSDGSTAVTFSDNLGDTYTIAFHKENYISHVALATGYLVNAPSGVTTVTLTGGALDTACNIVVSHYSGVATTSAVDQNEGAYNVQGTLTNPSSFTSGTVTTTSANELLIGGGLCILSVYGGVANNSFTGSNGFTVEGFTVDPNGNSAFLADEIVTSIQTNVAATGNVTGTNNQNIYNTGIITFVAAGSGAVAPVGQLYFTKQAVNRAATYFIETFLHPIWLPQPEIAFMNFKSRGEYIKQLLGFRKKWTLMDWKTSEGEAVFEPPVTDQQIHEYCELNR